MKHFNIDHYKYTNNVVMWCKDEAEAAIFEEYLKSAGREWINGIQYGELLYSPSYPCFSFNKGMRCSVETAVNRGWEVLEFDDYSWDDELTVSREAFQLQTDFLRGFAITT